MTTHTKCPKCDSKDVHIAKEGFDGGGACCGAICLGPLGLLCGTLGSKRLKAHCLACGKKFDIRKEIKKRNK